MATIGVFDSGSGGLSVLREMRRRLPEERYVYFADNANCPYGDKSAEFVRERAFAITDFLIGEGAEAIVVACNTATGAAISSLREHYSLPFIGMEPAIKPAAALTRSGVVGVLATQGTLAASNYLNTKNRFGKDVRIVEHVGAGFVKLVESLDLESENAERIVSESVRPLLDAGADVIVLGCTHYPFLRSLVSRVAGPDVAIVDPAPAVARRLCEVLADKGIPVRDKTPGVELHSSGPDGVLRALYERYIHLFS